MPSPAGRAGGRLLAFDGPGAASHPEAPRFPVPAVLDRAFLTDEVSLSLVATVAAWHGPRAERLFSDARRRQWLTAAGLPVPVSAATAPDWAGLSAVRSAVHELAEARIAGTVAAREAATVLADAAAAPLPRVGIGPDFVVAVDGPIGWTAVTGLIARSAIECLTGPWSTRIRVCDGDPCSHLFVDRTPGGTRRWCLAETCGNRARVRSHRRAAGSPASR